MAGLRNRIEDAFGAWSHVVARMPWVLVVAMLATTALLATRLPLMQVETSSEDYLFDGDPAKIAYNDLRSRFGRDQAIYVVIEPEEVFDLDFLEWLRVFHRDVESSVPHLQDVTSLVNARSVYGQGDQLFVDDLLEDWPDDQAALDALRARVLATPSYQHSLIAQEGRVTSMAIKSFAYSDEGYEADEEAAVSGFDEVSIDHA